MECPKCGAHIGRFELDQNCKTCGVNIFYYQQENLLSTDAKKCELEYASLRLFVAKLKTAFIKGALPIARLVATLVCVGMILIPFATLRVSFEPFSHSLSFGGIGLYQSFSDGSLMALFDFADIAVTGKLASGALLLIYSLLLIALFDILILVTELLSFINLKRSAVALAVFSLLGIGCSGFSFYAAKALASVSGSFLAERVSVSLGFGSLAAALAFAAMLIINILFLKKGIKPEYKEVDLQRVEMRKRVKRGEVSLAELPLPVFESDEEREKRLKEEAEEKEREERAKGAVKQNV